MLVNRLLLCALNSGGIHVKVLVLVAACSKSMNSKSAIKCTSVAFMCMKQFIVEVNLNYNNASHILSSLCFKILVCEITSN